jgi:hypothetical protein
MPVNDASELSELTNSNSLFTGMGNVSKDPDWSPGDRIKFRRSQDEAEILETKLEYDGGLMMKIQYVRNFMLMLKFLCLCAN